MNTRKLVLLFVILVLIYILFQIIIQSLNHGHYVDYKLKDKDTNQKFTIQETRTTRVKGERNNYYFEIDSGNFIFNFQDYQNFKKRNYVIKMVKYFKDNQYECIYPIFKDPELKMDILCQKNGIQYHYASLKHSNKKLFDFEHKMQEWGYSKGRYASFHKTKKDNKEISYYPLNINYTHIISMDHYKGLYILKNNDFREINLFENDQYKKEISAVVGKYYIVADYNEKYEFHQFLLVNLENYKKSKIHLNQPISFDSYVQGVRGDALYLLDVDHKKQYEINVKKKRVKEIGDEVKGIKFLQNNKFRTDKIHNYLNDKITFTDDYSNVFGEDYKRIDKLGKKLSGYYYLYKKKKDQYQVYQASVQNPQILTYIFSTDDLSYIHYDEDIIYYKDHNIIYAYLGNAIVPILENREFEFNNTLKIGLSIK